MQLTNRTVSALVTAAVTASLAIAPAILQPAGAASAPERTTVTAECAAAQTSLALAKSAQASAHHKVKKAKKALRKAKHTHSPARIRKAKRVLKKAKLRYAVATHNARVQGARVGYMCAAPNSSARAAGTGMELGILGIATGAAGKVLDLTSLNSLLGSLLPTDALAALTPTQLTALLSGYNAGTPSLDDATILLGSAFTPAELQALLAGTAGPDLVLALTQHVIAQLSALSGVAVPTPDATALQTAVTAVTSLLTGLTGIVGGTTSGTTSGGTTDPKLCLLFICL